MTIYYYYIPVSLEAALHYQQSLFYQQSATAYTVIVGIYEVSPGPILSDEESLVYSQDGYPILKSVSETNLSLVGFCLESHSTNMPSEIPPEVIPFTLSDFIQFLSDNSYHTLFYNDLL